MHSCQSSRSRLTRVIPDSNSRVTSSLRPSSHYHPQGWSNTNSMATCPSNLLALGNRTVGLLGTTDIRPIWDNHLSNTRNSINRTLECSMDKCSHITTAISITRRCNDNNRRSRNTCCLNARLQFLVSISFKGNMERLHLVLRRQTLHNYHHQGSLLSQSSCWMLSRLDKSQCSLRPALALGHDRVVSTRAHCLACSSLPQHLRPCKSLKILARNTLLYLLLRMRLYKDRLHCKRGVRL
jgi:hypothetical protein